MCTSVQESYKCSGEPHASWAWVICGLKLKKRNLETLESQKLGQRIYKFFSQTWVIRENLPTQISALWVWFLYVCVLCQGQAWSLSRLYCGSLCTLVYQMSQIAIPRHVPCVSSPRAPSLREHQIPYQPFGAAEWALLSGNKRELELLIELEWFFKNLLRLQ